MENTIVQFDEKIIKKTGLTKIEIQCWIQILQELNQQEYQREISGFTKHIKNEIFKLKIENNDNYEYFVDVNIRNSPSKTAFLSLQVSFVKDTSIIKVKKYLSDLKSLIQNYPNFTVFHNEKKRKK